MCSEAPSFYEFADGEQRAACHLYDETVEEEPPEVPTAGSAAD
jgi:hypothetical protein